MSTADRLPAGSDWGLLLEWLMAVKGYAFPRALARELGFSRQTMAGWMDGRTEPAPAARRYLTLELAAAARESPEQVTPEVAAALAAGGVRVAVLA